MPPSLSILCISRCDPFAMRSLEHLRALATLMDCEYVIAQDGGTLPVGLARYAVRVQSKGYLESVHDHAVALTSGDYVFRVDDDETCSLALVKWLLGRAWANGDHWAFPRRNMWDKEHYLTNGLLWPDLQTRLSRRELAGGRDTIHCGSPHGTGLLVYEGALQHWKFLKPYAERKAILDAYEAARPGSGTGIYRQFSVPEECFDEFCLTEVNDGCPPRETSSVPTAASVPTNAASGSTP